MPYMATELAALTRRNFLRGCPVGLGGIALATLLGTRPGTTTARAATAGGPLAPKQPPLVPKAKRVIYLHMLGAPSQLDLFDYKPELVKFNGKPCPDELLKNQRFAFIKGHPKLLGPPHAFLQRGQNGTWISELLPQLSKVVDDLTIVRSMSTDQFNHAPAQLFLHTGSARAGYPGMGSWVTYGLGRTWDDQGERPDASTPQEMP